MCRKHVLNPLDSAQDKAWIKSCTVSAHCPATANLACLQAEKVIRIEHSHLCGSGCAPLGLRLSLSARSALCSKALVLARLLVAPAGHRHASQTLAHRALPTRWDASRAAPLAWQRTLCMARGLPGRLHHTRRRQRTRGRRWLCGCRSAMPAAVCRARGNTVVSCWCLLL